MLNLENGRNYSCDTECSASLVTNGNATFRYFFNMINFDAGLLPLPLKNHNFSFSNFECCCCQSFKIKYIYSQRKRAKWRIFVKWKILTMKTNDKLHIDFSQRNLMPNHVLFAFRALIYEIVILWNNLRFLFLWCIVRN